MDETMKKEIIINSTPHEIRIAILEDGELVELLMERAESRRIVGNIYKGTVASVKPGLQAAFVDVGMDKAGFLHASDLVHEDPEDDDEERAASDAGREQRVPDIGKLLRAGDTLLVQVTKEQIGTKGPRLTADLSLPGRFLVLMPKGRHIGVSRKIEDRRERVRLKQILQTLRPGEGAYIIRTAAEGINESHLRHDVSYLSSLWREIQDKAEATPPNGLVHEDVGMVVGLTRDIFNEEVDRVVIDDRDDHERLLKYVQTFAPELKNRIQLYRERLPIFDHFEIEPEIRKSLDKRVWMKKGGYIVIEQTEALVSIDVNTGRFTGKRNQEETIFQTNMIAAREVARQLRLRDIGGIIVIDFIDMENEANRKRVLAELRSYLKYDRARTKAFAVSNLGLIEMSRQRVRPSLLSFLSDPCPYCTGTGKTLSLETLGNRIERLIHRIVTITRERSLQVQANPTLALYLLEEKAERFRELCRVHELEIDILDDPTLHREEFRILSLASGRDLLAEMERAGRQTGRAAPGRGWTRGAEPRPDSGREPERRTESARDEPARAEGGRGRAAAPRTPRGNGKRIYGQRRHGSGLLRKPAPPAAPTGGRAAGEDQGEEEER